MKTLLRASAAGLFLMLPAVSFGSQFSLFSDPNGAGFAYLPTTYSYPVYDARGGSKPSATTVVVSKPDSSIGNHNGTGGTTPAVTDNSGPPSNPPVVNDPVVTPPADPTVVQTPSPASVPLPASAEMAGAGVAAIMLFSWLRSRRNVQA